MSLSQFGVRIERDLSNTGEDYHNFPLVFLDLPGAEWLAGIKASWEKHERGSLPTIVEMLVIVWVNALVLKELRALYREGLLEYFSNMWNLVDIMRQVLHGLHQRTLISLPRRKRV